MKGLLISSSTIYGREYLEHASDWIKEHFEGVKKILFVPFALANWDEYTAKAQAAFAKHGIEVVSAHNRTAEELSHLLASVGGIFVGGGNTMRLKKSVEDCRVSDQENLFQAIQRRVIKEGLPYLGTSAGTNLGAKTIKTTNDMPIVIPQSFDGLGIVDFQINPHYQDPDPLSTHKGETREERLMQFHEENDTPVLGLREHSALKVTDGEVILLGPEGATARLFRKGQDRVEIPVGTNLTKILKPAESAATNMHAMFNQMSAAAAADTPDPDQVVEADQIAVSLLSQ